MQCAACELPLDAEDNYCRRCGAAVRVIAATLPPERREVVRIGPSAPALLAGAARPLATGAAAVAAGALVRFALRRALRGLAGPTLTPRTRDRAVARTEETSSTAAIQVTETFWYRRIIRTERT